MTANPVPPAEPGSPRLAHEPIVLALAETLLVAGLVAAPLLPDALAAGGFLLLSLLWLWLRPARERRLAGPILALALAALTAGWLAGLLEQPTHDEWVRATRREYSRLWDDLRLEAREAAAAVGGRPRRSRRA